ncbi:hypothetical protein F8388_006204 [Cannabis sativa]|uniref:Transferase n=1 Tax=Cannabis sativa TaxID=3483 RepID=A0A7J6IB79_CANSA|nr:hypothetical protein F8388_006204 [Cannabis sativa]KAF4404853.1 hypothetical protein G4B88_006239 [Cannabis sativa]
MENNLHVEIVSRENIKPSSPTPPNLKTFNLSLFDQRAPPVYTTLVLFYQISSSTDHSLNNNIIITTLKKSLSEALTSYVPLAGKIDNINNSNIVECTDEGAIFIEAKSNTILSTFLEENPNEDRLLERLLPAKTRSAEAATSPLLLVQVTLFECGGLAIGLCMSHKLADAATLCMFLKNWSNPGQRFTLTVPKKFDISPESIWFPLPRDQRNNNNNNNIESLMIKTVNKRYVFDKTKIDVLKSKASSERVKNPTRVEVVSALVWKCAINASSKLMINSLNSNNKYYSFLSQLVNVRDKVKPIQENTSGNLVGSYVVHVEYNNKEELELKNLVFKMRKAIKEYSNNNGEKQGRWCREVVELIKGIDDDMNNNMIFLCNSWCNFGFYEVNFGWGKPIWAWRPSSSIENVLKLMDTKNGGVEVSLTLSKENMALFERDPHILAFANPSHSII